MAFSLKCKNRESVGALVIDVDVTDRIVDDTVNAAVAILHSGGMVLVVDDPNRENEGDVICAAEYATPQVINFMASVAKGLVCMPMSAEWTQKLNLPQMVADNTDSYATAFTVSIDHIDTTTGISAFERSLTARKCVEEGASPEDFRRPGHMFPLEAKPGGVLERRGHTEATVDLLHLAGLKPVGLCCEIMGEDGRMLVGSGVEEFARRHRMPLVTIHDVAVYLQKAGEQRKPATPGVPGGRIQAPGRGLPC